MNQFIQKKKIPTAAAAPTVAEIFKAAAPLSSAAASDGPGEEAGESLTGPSASGESAGDAASPSGAAATDDSGAPMGFVAAAVVVDVAVAGAD